jgi:hypothetical protein
MTQTRTLTFLSDPGHGWLAVPYSDLMALKIIESVSTYSYHDKRHGLVWLEEDCDAGLYLQAAKAAGWQITINETNTNQEARVRWLPSFGRGGGDETAHYRGVGEIRKTYGRDRSMRGFIRRNRAEIDAAIRGRDGTATIKTINDTDREEWVLNDTGLYAWARSSGVRV